MTQTDDQSSKPSSVRKSVNTLTKYVNLASAGLAMLNAPRRIPTKAPPPEVIVRDKGFAIRIDEDVTEFDDPNTLAAELRELPEKRLDVIFHGRTALDLSFTIPNAPFSDLEAMIDAELAYRSPFQRDQCVWFWRAKETETLDWQVEAAIVLNASIDWVIAAFKETGKTINLARRTAPDGTTKLAVYPSWLTPLRRLKGPRTVGESIRKVPPSLRAPAIALIILLISAVALFAVQSTQNSSVSAQASAANAQIAQRAAEAARVQALKELRDEGAARSALVGSLAGLLPDDVWLEQLTIEDDRMTITGYAPSAAEVTRLLSTLDALSDIQFGSPVTRDNTQNQERFRIDATLTGNLG
ncbi:PilN domain-containing protein [Yoonia sp. BS5-3]|uniref:PilN domain-containing protein n=1 Tax=Yoonia phaeophyticola TaxID=3137369 RepID=A0ABZ2V6N8_9RHOB